MKKLCTYCNQPLSEEEVIPLKSYGKGIYAVESVTIQSCPTGEACVSGGGFTTWRAIGRLHDLAMASANRPFFAKYNPVLNDWEECLPPGLVP